MLALLYDVHGNLPALQAVLDDARSQGAERYLLGGDYVLFGGWPTETLALLDALAPATWLRGNGERWCAAPTEAPDDIVVQGAVESCRAAIGSAAVQRLALLPQSLEVGGAGPPTRAWHGSPLSDVRSPAFEPGPDDDELLAGVAEQRLIVGHTHIPFVREIAGVEVVNPGSVGMPCDGNPRASYALVDEAGAITHRRVHYDHAASARRAREVARGAQWGETIAKRIERALPIAR